MERHSSLLFPYIKKEFDHLSTNASTNIKFKIYSLLEANYYFFSQFEKAAAIAYELLRIAKHSKDSLHFYYAYSAISANEDELGSKYTAIDYLLKAHKYARCNNNALANSNIELGKSFSNIDKFDMAQSYLLEGINISLTNKNELQLSYGYSSMAQFLYETRNYDQALIYCAKVDSLGQKNKLLRTSNDILDIHVTSGLIYSEKKNFLTANIHFDKAQSIAETAGDLSELSFIYKSRSLLEESQGKFRESLFYHKNYSLLNDSIFTTEASIQLNALKIASEIDKKNLEIDIAKKNEEFSKRQFRYILIISVVLILSLIILIFFIKSKLHVSVINEKLTRQKNTIHQIEIENLESKVELKNKELADLFLHQFEKAELLTNVIQNIDKSNSKLKTELQEQLNRNDDWANFKFHFDKVHEGFFKKLSDLSNDFTPKDIRYCAYIRMNLTSKEIAIMLGISYRTVQGIRGRVRKKIKLEPKQDLVLFLMNL
ncbi:MAG: LuxR C-terminal-related transcriptional regulator [Bacteroidota bacterium]